MSKYTIKPYKLSFYQIKYNRKMVGSIGKATNNKWYAWVRRGGVIVRVNNYFDPKNAFAALTLLIDVSELKLQKPDATCTASSEGGPTLSKESAKRAREFNQYVVEQNSASQELNC